VKRDEVAVGDYVTVNGYGGFAKVLSIVEDGVDPRGNPKYRATVQWGPNNDRAGTAKKTLQVTKRTRTNALVEDYPLGRCEPAHEVTQARRIDAIDEMDEIEMLARLKELQAIHNR